MSGKKAWTLGIVLFLILAVFTYWLGMQFGRMAYSPTQSVSRDSWLIVDPSGLLPDYNEIQLGSFWGSGMQSVEDYTRKIRYASSDKRIKGILLEPTYLQTDYASLAEIVLALQDFSRSGKPIIAFGASMAQKDYYLCLAADEIYMEPSASGGLMLEGVSANIMFYKEMLDKIGVKMHVMQSGDYKGAGEPFSQTSLSPGTRDNISQALKGRYEILISALATSRGITEDAARKVFEERQDFFINSSDALEYGLVDAASTRDQLLLSKGINPTNSLRISKYQDESSTSLSGDIIAVINLSGNIAPSNPSAFGTDNTLNADKVQKALDAISDNSRVKAVVLRVNSPGGSALESEIIYQKLMLLKSKMPVVVSMGGVAASGGYYISCASDYIMADQLGITGSIGVIMMVPEATGLSRKIGLRSESIGYGKFAGAFDPLNPYDPEFLRSLQRNSSSIYSEFKARVISARGYTEEEIQQVAEGRIFSAADALENGLIDEIGSLTDAVAKAAELAKISNYQVRNLPKKRSFYELLMENRNFPLLISQTLKARSMSPMELAEEFLNSLSTDTWLYYLPFKLD